MKITRSNYETWFADWLDNNLTDRQVEELNAFLAENHDLAVEFSELREMVLNPAGLQMPGREMLLKDPGEMDQLQFELLCAAAADGGLAEDQLSDFHKMLEGNAGKLRTAGLFRKIRLVPENVTFPHRYSLLKKSAAQKIVSIALPLLGAAAAIVLVLLAIVPQKEVVPLASGIFEIDYDDSQRIVVSTSNTVPTAPVASPPKTLRKADEGKAPEKEEIAISPAQLNLQPEIQFRASIASIEKPAVEARPVSTSLVPITTTVTQPEPVSYDERSSLRKLLAFKFREKILNEELPENNPVEPFEIAEAGITGLNKLFGWEMSLSRNTDENGDVKSVRFSSRLIKFSGPARNNEIAE